MRILTAPTKVLVGALLVLLASACVPATGTVPSAPRLLQRDAPSGKILYVRDGDIWMWQNGDVRQFSTGGTWHQPAWSPNGREIAYVYLGRNFSDIFVMGADGADARRLTKGQATYLPDNDWAMRPTWSPDGSQIAFVSDSNSYFPLVWVMNKDGGNRRQLVTAATGLEAADALSWSPDGKSLAVTAMGKEASQIYLVDVARGTAEKLTSHPKGAFDPAWSPDGDSIAYIARDGANGDLHVRNVDGTRDASLGRLPYVRAPAWSPDGTSLAVVAAPSGVFQIWVMSVTKTAEGYQLGEPRQITNDSSIDATAGLSWTAS
ncbi:MAG: PD40 domain-containing protein [Chloroflexi bacterium]|nr:PD40 domain-containing protein [Chloroflexota bacterium]